MAINIDPVAATELAKAGATFVLLDVPQGTEFGIDLNVFNVGEKFKGLKMIPPGFHFIFYSAVNQASGQGAPRSGFFHWFSSQEFMVRKWDSTSEGLSKEEISEEEIQRLKAHQFGDLDRFLGPYPLESWRKWVSLTSFISEPLLKRLQPECGIISSVAQLLPMTNSYQNTVQVTDLSTMKEKDLLPEMTPLPGTQLNFTPIPKQRHPSGCSPSELSKHHIDSSYLLESLLLPAFKGNWEDILGELQMAFVAFVFGQVWSAFEHWRDLLLVLASCDEALPRLELLYDALIPTLHWQIREMPSDYLIDLSGHNFLNTSLSCLFANISESQVPSSLKEKAMRFKNSLSRTLKWDFDSELEDDLPVVVDIPEAVEE